MKPISESHILPLAPQASENIQHIQPPVPQNLHPSLTNGSAISSLSSKQGGPVISGTTISGTPFTQYDSPISDVLKSKINNKDVKDLKKPPNSPIKDLFEDSPNK